MFPPEEGWNSTISSENLIFFSFFASMKLLRSYQFKLFRRGMSKFYSGKSKSFTSLADVVSCSSIKEIVKPENALTRKRKNLLAHATFCDKNCNFSPKNNSNSISKKPTNSNRSSSSISSNESDHGDNFNSNASSRPPLHPKSKKSPNDESSSSPVCRNFSPWRSFSLCDLAGEDTPH